MRQVGSVYLAETAILTGDVTCGEDVNLWFGAVVRGDVAPVTLGDFVNLQDCVIVHCDFGVPNVIEPGVVAGHAAILHGKRVGAGTLVGMRATLLSGSEIGEECLIAAGAVVPPGMIVPPRSVVMGLPGKIVRSITAEEIAMTKTISKRYRELAKQSVSSSVA